MHLNFTSYFNDCKMQDDADNRIHKIVKVKICHE